MSTPLSGPARQTSPLAITSLVFGLLGFLLLPLIGSLVAIVTGHLARGEIRRAPERVEGDMVGDRHRRPHADLRAGLSAVLLQSWTASNSSMSSSR